MDDGTLFTTITLGDGSASSGAEDGETYLTAVMRTGWNDEPMTKAGKTQRQYSPCVTSPDEKMKRSSATAVPDRPAMRRYRSLSRGRKNLRRSDRSQWRWEDVRRRCERWET